jgi:hypothetical protein
LTFIRLDEVVSVTKSDNYCGDYKVHLGITGDDTIIYVDSDTVTDLFAALKKLATIPRGTQERAAK